jgi:hypothetical protein
VIRHINWQPQYPTEEADTYNASAYKDAESTTQELIEARRQMGPEEGARFDTQLYNEQRKMLAIAKQAVAL